jgi:Tol biopolymer transport system component
VYKAQDSRVGRQVALKILPESLAADVDRRRRFEQEARLAAALNHPNIMSIYDVGLDAHPPYIVAELVPGESLRAMIERGPVAPRKAIDVAAQVAAGLAAAHAAGIVHRDLKPENVMLTPDGTAKILDFGVARMQPKTIAGDQTATLGQTSAGAVVGTAAYMSPEQARAQEVDYRSDQFSLGLVLYEMLSGRQAFARPSAVQTMSAIVEDEPPPLERAIPTQLRWILDRCLAKERESRYESTRDLARELTQLRDHFSELTAATGSAQAAIGRPRRRMSIATTAASAIAAALAAWGAARLLTDPRLVDISRYRLTPFASSLAEQFAPAWSPDGKSIAFIGRTPAGALAIFVQAADAHSATAITGNDTEVLRGATIFWSPDSRSIYYRCVLQSKWGLCRVPASGGISVMAQKDEIAGTISPDGGTLITFTFTFPDSNLWVSQPIGTAPRKYEPGAVKVDSFYNTPVLSFAPDGRKIVFSVAMGGKGETAWLLPWPPHQNGARRIFPEIAEFSYTPQWKWLPDSRHLIFSARDARLYIADLDTGRYWPALVQDRPAVSPTVSPDGSRVAYVSDLSHADVVAVPLGVGPVRTLLGGTHTHQMADISSNGQVVYLSDHRGVSEVWISSLAEGWERPLVSPSEVKSGGETAQFLMTPALSRDGRRVAFPAKFPASDHIFTLFATGGTPVEATAEKAGFEMTPAWSPDGNWLAYTLSARDKTRLMKIRPGSGEPPVALGDYFGWAVPEWSPTGEWIACPRFGDEHLMLVSADGKTARELTDKAGPVAWAQDGRTLYQAQIDPAVLVEIDIATGRVRKLRDLGDMAPYATMHPGLKAALMPDGKSIVYTVNRPRQEIWILDGLEVPKPWYRRLLP